MSPEPLPSKIGKSVGEKLRAARIAQHYTQSQLAAPDFSVSYISAIERGQIHPSLRALEILAGRLGLSSTQLLPNRAQAEDRLNSALNAPEREDDEMEITLLEADIFIRQGLAAQAITQLSKLSTKRLKRQQQLQHRYLLGWAYLKAARFQEGEYTLSEALQLAKDLNASYLHLRILNLQALTYAAMRNYTQAILSHQRCLNLLENVEPRDPFFTAEVYMHMGQHYTHLENFEQAQQMFNTALSIVEELAGPQAIEAVYWNISQNYADAKEYDLASMYAYKCLQLHTQLDLTHIRSQLHHYLGHAMMKGDREEARAYLNTALQQESVERDHLALASVSIHNAEWYLTCEALDEAEKNALQANELAAQFGDTLIGAEAHITLGRIQYAHKRYEEGDKNFVTGLHMLERLGQHEELADESVQYAQLLEELGKEHEAFTYFRLAFQSKQKQRR
ncbi:tetratricopeptide repeat protein [Ktedonosporobacter rubrisoli]|uniref:Tetratricopeptide repeat protein n=1 Tax=Ktedonosporobacter rubrisoli TaxID=2509675 RepID=A0A4P6JVZ8_KTERU|nr:helix-turn-helix transcriptional regulator [Ktedonosporobacter rubrisoli]QBD79635.1 tetratricopeptide repeat protein [Ktedonosporobacter rubrisoli]